MELFLRYLPFSETVVMAHDKVKGELNITFSNYVKVSMMLVFHSRSG